MIGVSLGFPPRSYESTEPNRRALRSCVGNSGRFRRSIRKVIIPASSLIDIVLVHRALEILLAAAPAGADAGADHPADHLQMPVTEIRQLLVDLDERVEQGERQTKERFVAIEHDEERRAQ